MNTIKLDIAVPDYVLTLPNAPKVPTAEELAAEGLNPDEIARTIQKAKFYAGSLKSRCELAIKNQPTMAKHKATLLEKQHALCADINALNSPVLRARVEESEVDIMAGYCDGLTMKPVKSGRLVVEYLTSQGWQHMDVRQNVHAGGKINLAIASRTGGTSRGRQVYITKAKTLLANVQEKIACDEHRLDMESEARANFEWLKANLKALHPHAARVEFSEYSKSGTVIYPNGQATFMGCKDFHGNFTTRLESVGLGDKQQQLAYLMATAKGV